VCLVVVVDLIVIEIDPIVDWMLRNYLESVTVDGLQLSIVIRLYWVIIECHWIENNFIDF